MTKNVRYGASRMGRVLSGLAGLCLSLTVAGSAGADTTRLVGIATSPMQRSGATFMDFANGAASVTYRHTTPMLRSASPTMVPGVALFIFDSTFGDTQRPLYFQVVGQGFRPGERVTLKASVALSGPGAEPAVQLVPVQVDANDYGRIAATLDGGGSMGAGDGFVIRATGDQHVASIVDLVLPGASHTAP